MSGGQTVKALGAVVGCNSTALYELSEFFLAISRLSRRLFICPAMQAIKKIRK
jgi:hypothetical protein